MSVVPEKLIAPLRSLPEWNETEFLKSHEKPAVISVRLNERKKGAQFANATPVPWCQDAYYLSERPYFTHDPLLHAGAYYVQEASSMILQVAMQQWAPIEKPIIVLDLCASPGGKSTLLANCLNIESLLISNELIKTRVAPLVENISKWGPLNSIVTSADPKAFSMIANLVDVLVIDAPCSGSGLFRKDANAVKEWSEENVAHCSLRQKRIIQDSWNSLKVGGVLIYSTCSFSAEENEAIIDSVMEELGATNLTLNLSDSWNIQTTESAVKKGKGYRFFPHRLQGEGFFLAGFRKEKTAQPIKTNYAFLDSNATTFEKTFKGSNDSKKSLKTDQLLKVDRDKVKNWVAPAVLEKCTFFEIQGTVRAFPTPYFSVLEDLKKMLFIAKAGIAVGLFKGHDFIPDQELAWSLIMHPEIPTIEVNLEQALAYLKREEINLPDCRNGWQLITYKNLSLGWVKVLPGRVNNYYPKEYRILK